MIVGSVVAPEHAANRRDTRALWRRAHCPKPVSIPGGLWHVLFAILIGTGLLIPGASVAQGRGPSSFSSMDRPADPGPSAINVAGGLPVTDLEISKSDGATFVVHGWDVSYEILVANRGPSSVIGARVRDPMSGGLSNVFWFCMAVQGATCPSSTGQFDLDQLVDLPVDGILRYFVLGRVTAPPGDTLTNTATIEVPDGMLELDASDNTAIDINDVESEGLYTDGFEALSRPIGVPVRQHWN